MPPAFVYFDLGNVIASFDRRLAFERMATVCGADAEAVQRAVMPDLQADLESGRLDWNGFHAEFSRRTGTRSDPSRLADAAADMFALNASVLPVIAALERARVPLGILSNTCEIHWRHLLDLGWGVLPGRFRQIVLSYEAGASKPEREIYELATRRAGVAPEAIFFCDDLPEHVAAARDAGWDAEVFTSATALVAQFDRRGLNLGL
jgi:HAD superfamily hydrolase (TIGR01509 family)